MFRRVCFLTLFGMLTLNVFGADRGNLYIQLQNIQQQRLVNTQRIDRLGEYGLRILRNGVFAAHGRPFASKELNFFFYNREDMQKEFGFKVDAGYRDSSLTEIDKQNIEIILQAEQLLSSRWKDASIPLTDVLESYRLNNPEAYTLHDSNGEVWTSGIVGPTAYRVYPHEDNPLVYYILLEEMMLVSDSFIQRTFLYNNGDYSILDYQHVTSGMATGFATQAMSVWHSRQEVESFDFVQTTIESVVTELFFGGIAVESYNSDWLKRNLEEGW